MLSEFKAAIADRAQRFLSGLDDEEAKVALPAKPMSAAPRKKNARTKSVKAALRGR